MSIDRQKITTVVWAYCKALNIDSETRTILANLMIRLAEKYSKYVPSVQVPENELALNVIKTGDYASVEDFLLNRLINNVTTFMFFDPLFRVKGQYNYNYKEVDICKEEIDESVDYIKKTIEQADYKVPGDLRESIFRKVIMHEFEHALKTGRIASKLDDSDLNIVTTISDILAKTPYANIIRSSSELRSINERIPVISGDHYGDLTNHDSLRFSRSNKSKYEKLDEILNENESVEMARCPVQAPVGASDLYYKFRNLESVSSPYYSTAEMLSALMGTRMTFDMLYVNPQEEMMKFNEKYNKFFQKAYNTDEGAFNIVCGELEKWNITSKLYGMVPEKIKLESTILLAFYGTLAERFKNNPGETLDAWRRIKDNCLVFGPEFEKDYSNIEAPLIKQYYSLIKDIEFFLDKSITNRMEIDHLMRSDQSMGM